MALRTVTLPDLFAQALWTCEGDVTALTAMRDNAVAQAQMYTAKAQKAANRRTQIYSKVKTQASVADGEVWKLLDQDAGTILVGLPEEVNPPVEPANP